MKFTQVLGWLVVIVYMVGYGYFRFTHPEYTETMLFIKFLPMSGIVLLVLGGVAMLEIILSSRKGGK